MYINAFYVLNTELTRYEYVTRNVVAGDLNVFGRTSRVNQTALKFCNCPRIRVAFRNVSVEPNVEYYYSRNKIQYGLRRYMKSGKYYEYCHTDTPVFQYSEIARSG